MSISSDLKPILPLSEGPPLPEVLAPLMPYLPWKGYWPWHKNNTDGSSNQIGIQIYDSSGKLIVSSGLIKGMGPVSLPVNPGSLVAGSTGNTAVVTLNNTSKYSDGVTPAPFIFWLYVSIISNSTIVLANNVITPMTAGQTGLQQSFTFSVPITWPTNTGALANAKLVNPADGTTIGSVAQIVVPIAAAGVIPGGSVIF